MGLLEVYFVFFLEACSKRYLGSLDRKYILYVNVKHNFFKLYLVTFPKNKHTGDSTSTRRVLYFDLRCIFLVWILDFVCKSSCEEITSSKTMKMIKKLMVDHFVKSTYGGFEFLPMNPKPCWGAPELLGDFCFFRQSAI